jgi:hypothetical protein
MTDKSKSQTEAEIEEEGQEATDDRLNAITNGVIDGLESTCKDKVEAMFVCCAALTYLARDMGLSDEEAISGLAGFLTMNPPAPPAEGTQH